MLNLKFILICVFAFVLNESWAQVTISIKEICIENCTDGIDNDNDGLTDCQDLDCIDYFKNLLLLKSNNDSLLCNINVIQDTIETWSDCVDVIMAAFIDTSAVPLDSIQCIRYDPMDSSCGGPTISCSSTLLCPQNSCGDYFVSLIGSNNQVLTSEVIHIKERVVDYDLLICAFPDTDSVRLVEVAAAFNKYKDQFGINTQGNCEFFTRAIDRAHTTDVLNILEKIPLLGGNDNCDELDYFNIADKTWSEFQKKVAELLGVENVSIKEREGGHLNYTNVYRSLKSDTPVNFVSCE